MPFDLRITDVHGQQVIETGIPLSAGQDIAGSNQFPVCVPEPEHLERWALLLLLLMAWGSSRYAKKVASENPNHRRARSATPY